MQFSDWPFVDHEYKTKRFMLVKPGLTLLPFYYFPCAGTLIAPFILLLH